MVNSESRSPNDQVPPSTCSPHEDACKEAETKLEECALAHLASKVDDIATKEFKGLKAAFNDDYNKYTDYMIVGPL